MCPSILLVEDNGKKGKKESWKGPAAGLPFHLFICLRKQQFVHVGKCKTTYYDGSGSMLSFHFRKSWKAHLCFLVIWSSTLLCCRRPQLVVQVFLPFLSFFRFFSAPEWHTGTREEPQWRECGIDPGRSTYFSMSLCHLTIGHWYNVPHKKGPLPV